MNNIINAEKVKDYELTKTIHSDIQLIIEGQKLNHRDLQRGFIGLAEQNRKLNQQLEKVVAELDILKKEKEEKAARKKARAARKRIPKRQPMTSAIYQNLIKHISSPNYRSVRLRICFCLLVVTGVRINELLPLKIKDLQTLLELNWIAIDRSKLGPANHKAFLTSEGKKLVNERKKDFELLFLMKNADSYVFTSELKPDQMLRRETITRDVNKAMRSVARNLPDQPNITSHSFRIGYISKLWKDTKDIEFVRQSIGHRSIASTSSYVKSLSDQERQHRTSLLN
jgi:integrase